MFATHSSPHTQRALCESDGSNSSVADGNGWPTYVGHKPDAAEVRKLAELEACRKQAYADRCATRDRASAAEPEQTEPEGENLQDAFATFRAKKAAQIKERKRRQAAAKKAAENKRAAPGFQDELRLKFVEKCKAYLGVPYSRKTVADLVEEGHPDHDSEHFLDCCGLVRRVLRDLSDDFGFEVGPWNQCYQYETLCESEVDEKDRHTLKPGDVVFSEAVYFDPLRQKGRTGHMTHIEVLLDPLNGETSIGSRKLLRVPITAEQVEHGVVNSMGEAQPVKGPELGAVPYEPKYEFTSDLGTCGHVAYHPTFRYKSTSYKVVKYHYCSIEPWLQGDCRPRRNEWSGQYNGEWISESKDGRKSGKQGRSVFAAAGTSASDEED